LPLPNFLIIGAAKSGTSALYMFLRQHPQVFMSPNKEPRYFSFAGQQLDPTHPVHSTTVTRLEDYLDLFAEAGDAIAIGEASPSYLHNPAAPPRIQDMIPDAKLIAMLRNPADRAYSHFMHFVKQGIEVTTDFAEAVDSVDALSRNDWYPRRDYLSFGYYGRQLARYYERFDRDQIKVYIYEEYRQAPSASLKDVFRFLRVDPEFDVDTALEINVSGKPRSTALHRWLRRPSGLRHFAGRVLPARTRRRLMSKLESANLERSTLTAGDRRALMAVYREDIQLLEDLLQRRLDCWKG
jgi:hypothetical protein